jgi:hypothetical protein
VRSGIGYPLHLAFLVNYQRIKIISSFFPHQLAFLKNFTVLIAFHIYIAGVLILPCLTWNWRSSAMFAIARLLCSRDVMAKKDGEKTIYVVV